MAAHSAPAGHNGSERVPLLQYLLAHRRPPEFTRRFLREVGLLAFRDHRRTEHNPINDYRGLRRVMRRGSPATAR